MNGNRRNNTDKVSTGNQLTSDGTFDSEGNLKLKKIANTSTVVEEYTWDYRQRLTLVTFKNAGVVTKTVEYVYDTFDRRVSTTVTDYVSGVAQTPHVESQVFDEGAKARGNVLLDFVDTDGPSGNAPAVSKRYLWNDAVDQIFAQEDDNVSPSTAADRFVWLIQDRLGTVRDVLDRTGAVVARVEYDSFGRITSIKDGSGQTLSIPPTRFGFTAQEYDAHTGLVWYSDGSGRGRWYSPTLQRFINRDERGFAAGDANLYRYVGNSPTNFTDPSGREIYDVPSGTQPNLGALAGYGGRSAPTQDLGPKIGLDDFNQPDVAMLESESR